MSEEFEIAIKGYPHIGYPLNPNKKEKYKDYITNKENIIKHAFLPFIHVQIISSKNRKEYDNLGNVLNNGKRKWFPKKVRNIYYASHLDANIFAYYAHILNNKYEEKLKEKGLTNVVTAYRQIPIIQESEQENSKTTSKKNRCNIHHALEVFNTIQEKSNDEEVIVIALDIKGFFDNLNHKKLKSSWCNILGEPNLPKDHHNVFQHITKFSYINIKDILKCFDNRVILKNKNIKEIKSIKYLQQQEVIAFCEKNKKNMCELRKRGYIRSNKYKSDGKTLRDSGICQGSSISCILANIYMLEFDEKINQYISSINGIYRRYSDDMVVVCNKNNKDLVINFFQEQISAIMLEIQEDKTQIFHFSRKNGKLTCSQEFGNTLNIKRNFEYLGLSFNGSDIYLKTSALAKYYRKMKHGVNRRKRYCQIMNNDTQGILFKRSLYKSYSYVGAKRKLIYRYNSRIQKHEKTNRYSWGNFITYAKLAIKILNTNGYNGNKIKHQIKNHAKILHRMINEEN